MTKNRFTSTFNFTNTKKVKTTKKTEKTTQQVEPRSPKKGLRRKQNQPSIYKKTPGCLSHLSMATAIENLLLFLGNVQCVKATNVQIVMKYFKAYLTEY